LGGGSSDAATVLLALNQLWGLRYERHRLAAIGLELGADVPVFVHGASAWGEGVGERLEPLPAEAMPWPWLVVVDPGVAVSTAAVFNDPGLTRDSKLVTIRDLRAGAVWNDCEPVVRARWPAVREVLEWLSMRGEAKMSGTGGCCFLGLYGEAEARTVLRELPSRWSGFAARAVARSPLEAELEVAAPAGGEFNDWGVAKR
ncbi:4-(cytidine 5'-diphospho)-2-C-methyl-D-erythritol kinase, partial [Halorhodospira abdelmalekii]|uniref:4-(cytidine 5'-diphospho)-2-C-methyl-D-erythritol kinase n=1 Tax=Halorhodospira abdelmalekii TaxID=421629 RepID=UPI0019054E86